MGILLNGVSWVGGAGHKVWFSLVHCFEWDGLVWSARIIRGSCVALIGSRDTFRVCTML